MRRLYHVDAFASAPFTGNPAGVCLLDQAASEAWMAAVAAEMNLSETAFAVAAAPNEYGLRWFTPKKEVTLCGHATLAAAHVLWEEGIVAAGEIRFSTLSGVLKARRGAVGMVELDFPARIASPAAENPAVSRALGATPLFTSVYRTPNGPVYILELESEGAVRALSPDFGALLATDARAVAATSASRVPGCDFTSRQTSAPFSLGM